MIDAVFARQVPVGGQTLETVGRIIDSVQDAVDRKGFAVERRISGERKERRELSAGDVVGRGRLNGLALRPRALRLGRGLALRLNGGLTLGLGGRRDRIRGRRRSGVGKFYGDVGVLPLRGRGEKERDAEERGWQKRRRDNRARKRETV